MNLIEDFIWHTLQTRNISYDQIPGYGDSLILNWMKSLSIKWQVGWMSTLYCLSQPANGLCRTKNDACTMEGFERKRYNEILGLNEKGLNACIIATTGYRYESNRSQHLAKETHGIIFWSD